VESEFSTLFLCPERAEMSRSRAGPREDASARRALSAASCFGASCLSRGHGATGQPPFPAVEPCLRVVGPPDMARELAVALRLDGRWRVGVQRGRDLGKRLQEAFAAAFRAGCGKVVAVGTDTPWMGKRRILQALRLLDTADVVPLRRRRILPGRCAPADPSNVSADCLGQGKDPRYHAPCGAESAGKLSALAA
jgi:Uncharacterized protein conserved in bacteria (DUF2064)